ncbi:transglutaminase family protein [Puniceicoccus vermicola]|uniref:Transglutaminase family protein n=1 Tax=Puniceicoccus vermicola TaxID=388746 RepID=A0A7X1E4J3_9BACT|nr:transglutaminase family protein [Puniceicoccus vermicola]MBC2602119.1 transglutaminase family protein [Puniceicoccus vermicola]
MEDFSLKSGDRLYEVYHVTRYDYDGPVSLSLQALRITPRFRRFHQTLETEPGGNLRFLRDAFENPTYSFEYIGQTEVLSLTNRMKIIRSGANPYNFLLGPSALARPIVYNDSEKQALMGYFEPSAIQDPILKKAAQIFIPEEKETVSFLAALNQNIHTKLEYEPRDEPGIYTTEEILDRGKGSCRDFAALLQKLLQYEGLATRFVSGYLLETGDLQGAEAMHAWTEVYLPGAGWIGMDPTNGILTDDAFVPCAVAVNPDETTPIGGRYFAQTQVISSLSTELQIRCIGEGK